MKAREKMAEDKRKGWLKELKVGDYVLVKNNNFGWGEKELVLRTVSKITPTGKMIVGGITFKSDGGMQTNNIYNQTYLLQATEELIDKMINQEAKEKMLSNVQNYLANNRDKISYELLKEIYLKLKESENE